MQIPGPSIQEFVPLLQLMLSDSHQYGEMFLKFSDSAAYGNNMLHVCVELHNIDFTSIILGKNGEYQAGLCQQRNGNGLTPSELLEKEIEKVANGLNAEKRAR